jgi:hypothetical protein
MTTQRIVAFLLLLAAVPSWTSSRTRPRNTDSSSHMYSTSKMSSRGWINRWNNLFSNYSSGVVTLNGSSVGSRSHNVNFTSYSKRGRCNRSIVSTCAGSSGNVWLHLYHLFYFGLQQSSAHFSPLLSTMGYEPIPMVSYNTRSCAGASGSSSDCTRWAKKAVKEYSWDQGNSVTFAGWCPTDVLVGADRAITVEMYEEGMFTEAISTSRNGVERFHIAIQVTCI